MFFWNSLDFLMIQQVLAIWSLVPLPFLKPAWTSGSSWFMYCWSLNFEHYFTSVWDECNCVAFLGIAFPLDWNENWPFPVLWPLLSFPNLLTYWVQHFHSIIFQYLKQLNLENPMNIMKRQNDRIPKEELPRAGFSRQEYWSGLPFPSPGDLPDPEIEPGSPTLEADTLTSEPPGKPAQVIRCPICYWRPVEK